MTRKISTYGARLARKKALNLPTNTDWAKPILMSRGFDEKDAVSSPEISDIAKNICIKLQDSIAKITHGTEPTPSTSAHDMIAHCLGVAQIRVLDIGGDGADDLLTALHDGVYGLERCRSRWESTGKWGFDGPAMTALNKSAEIYEMILYGSSPYQMENAQMHRLDVIRIRQRKTA